MFSSKVENNHLIYTDGLKNLKRLMVVQHWLMSSNLEDHYVEFLKEMVSNLDTEWIDFKDVILEEIELYEITQEDVQQELKSFIKVKPLVC
ncbi:hypothetical protein FB550_102448 [Neobacillus bataviensis]|uniref:Uncharacterized protein n=1 Tax=Neobacillus bataviensis TaxID=220685 RepID=A0A561DSV0_9BACI|nr:hypothetical protein [Neobacillus bataviensis]TWE06426.1 hypothetical protein FB550_102448 [Neobacillus bataviensis]